MTPLQAAEKLNFEIITPGGNDIRDIRGIHCGDLMSVVMSKAEAGQAWITVMGNVNAVAVAVLSDLSCVIFAEGAAVDDAAVTRAKQQGVCLLKTPLTVFETALALHRLISNP